MSDSTTRTRDIVIDTAEQMSVMEAAGYVARDIADWQRRAGFQGGAGEAELRSQLGLLIVTGQTEFRAEIRDDEGRVTHRVIYRFRRSTGGSRSPQAEVRS